MQKKPHWIEEALMLALGIAFVGGNILYFLSFIFEWS